MIEVEIKNYEKPETVVGELFGDVIVEKTSPRVSYEYSGCKCGKYLRTQDKNGIEEELSNSILWDLFYEDYWLKSFHDVDMENPVIETVEGDVCEVTNIGEAMDIINGNAECHLRNKDEVIENILNKSRGMFELKFNWGDVQL